MAKHKNIPFFIPHSGCKNNCVFCSQTKITGFALPTSDILAESVRLKATVDEALEYMNGAEAQIGFFGGSFTGIEEERMLLLLKTAYDYVKKGLVKGIRLSTRPDYINESILDVLQSYGVTDIELGLQSTDEDVLKASGRGHGRAVCFESAAMIVDRGFGFGGQMMIGLPLSTKEKELQTARDIVAMGATSARIYPTVVFEGTALYDMALSGVYAPIDNDTAVETAAECLRIFKSAGVDILRIGLHASEELKNAPFGANHPAIGEMVYSRVAYEEIKEMLRHKETKGKVLKIYTIPKGVSVVSGQKGINKEKLTKEFGFKKIKIYTADTEGISLSIEAED